MKKAIFGPSDCEDTKNFAANLPHYVSNIARRYGQNIAPEEVKTPYGVRPTSYNLEDGIDIPGVRKHRRDIRRDIRNEIGRIPVTFS
jgi:hypothetical protein